MTPIETELAALRAHPPVEVDVADRVMARVAALSPPSTAPAPGSWRRVALAAGLAGVAAAAGIVGSWPAARAVVGGAVLELLALTRALGGSSTTVASVSRGISRTLDVASATAGALATALEPLGPAANAASLVLTLLTASTVVIVVLRDFSRAPSIEER